MAGMKQAHENFYSEKVMHYLHSLPNSGVLNVDNKSIFMAEKGSLAAGIKIKLYIKIKSGIIQTVKYLVYGDSYTIAALAMLSEQLVGVKTNRAINYNFETIINTLGLPQTFSSNLKLIKSAIVDIMNQYSSYHQTQA